MQHPIILFDGVCNFCNFWVKFVAKHDRKNTFKFAPIQSEVGQKLLQQFNEDGKELSSVILIKDHKIFHSSTAALSICKELDGGWKFFYALIIVPPFIRDKIYRYIAKNRYTWFGKSDVCMIPNEALKSRFLESDSNV